MMNQKGKQNKKPYYKPNPHNLRTTKTKLDEILFKFEKYKGNDTKQQEFKDELNKFLQSLKFMDKQKVSAGYFLEYLHSKFISFLKQGEYNYENVIENALAIYDKFSNLNISEIEDSINRITYESLTLTNPPVRRSILNDTLSNKEFTIFLQLFKYFDEDINNHLKCCIFYQVLLKSYKEKNENYKKHCIVVATKVSDRVFKQSAIFVLFALITAKVWYNYCASVNQPEDAQILFKIFKGVAKKNKGYFSNHQEMFFKKVLEKLGGDYQRESETISALILAIVSITVNVPLVLPVIVSYALDTLSWDTISRLMNPYIWVIGLNKKEFVQPHDSDSVMEKENIDYENYNNNNVLRDVIFLLLKDIMLESVAKFPETYVRVVKFFSALQQTQKNEILEKLLHNFISNLQTTLAKDIYYKKTLNRHMKLKSESEDEPMIQFLKAIDDKSAELTKFWSFIFFLNYSDTPCSSLYLDLIFTREYQVAEIILWIHSCYTFAILNRVVIKRYLKQKIKELIRENDEKNLLMTYLKNMEYIVEYSSISIDANLLGAIYKLLFDLLIFYLEKLVEGTLLRNEELELLIEFIFKVLGSGENSRLLPLIVYEIDNIQYKKIISLLCKIVFELGYEHHFFQRFIKIIIILSRSEERRFIILLTQIFSILGYQLQAWRNNSTFEDVHITPEIKEMSSLQKELFSALKISNYEESTSFEIKSVTQREAIGLLILESALGLNMTQYIYTDERLKEITKQIHTENKLDPSSDTYKSCLGVLRKMFEWLFYESSPERSIAIYKETLPRYSTHAFDEYLRKTVFENRFLLSLLQMLILTTGFKLSNSQNLSDMTLCVLANLISVYNDKANTIKPYLTTKVLMKTLAQRDIIDQRFSHLADVVDKLSYNSLRDIMMIIFNFICQFNTFSTKKASLIDKAQLIYYRSNIKAILLDEIKNITSVYKHIKDVFS